MGNKQTIFTEEQLDNYQVSHGRGAPTTPSPGRGARRFSPASASSSKRDLGRGLLRASVPQRERGRFPVEDPPGVSRSPAQPFCPRPQVSAPVSHPGARPGLEMDRTSPNSRFPEAARGSESPNADMSWGPTYTGMRCTSPRIWV